MTFIDGNDVYYHAKTDRLALIIVIIGLPNFVGLIDEFNSYIDKHGYTQRIGGIDVVAPSIKALNCKGWTRVGRF